MIGRKILVNVDWTGTRIGIVQTSDRSRPLLRSKSEKILGYHLKDKFKLLRFRIRLKIYNLNIIGGHAKKKKTKTQMRNVYSKIVFEFLEEIYLKRLNTFNVFSSTISVHSFARQSDVTEKTLQTVCKLVI